MFTIGDVLLKKGTDVATISQESTALHPANLMNERPIGALCVVEAETLLGVFAERDLLNRVVSSGRDPATTTVAEMMTSSLITCVARCSWRLMV